MHLILISFLKILLRLCFCWIESTSANSDVMHFRDISWWNGWIPNHCSSRSVLVWTEDTFLVKECLGQAGCGQCACMVTWNCFCLLCMFVCYACVSPEAVNNYSCEIMLYWPIKKCYNFPVSYMALAVNILDGRGLSNKLHHGCQQKETKAILRLLRLAVLHR